MPYPMTASPSAAHPHFLIATDLAPELRQHIAFATRLADSFAAHVTLFHAVPIPVPLVHGAPLLATQPQVMPTDAIRQQVQELADSVRMSRPLHVKLTIDSAPVDAILAAATSTRADAIVLPTHARTGLKRAVFGSVAENVLRRARVPVVLISEAMVDRGLPRTERRTVLFTTDLSDTAAAALPTAVELARRLKLPLVLFSTVSPLTAPPVGGGAPIAPPPDEPRRHREECVAALRRLAETLPTDLIVETHAVIEPDTGAAIGRAAIDANAAFVVIATHGRTGIARLLMGSVAESVARTCQVPVVCVPSQR